MEFETIKLQKINVENQCILKHRIF